MNGLRIGWIGLGIMGRPMARNLRQAGFSVTAWNRNPARLTEWVRDGGGRAESPRDVAAASDVVVTMVSDTADVEQVLFGPRGVAEGLRRGQVVVDMSTISPEASRAFAGRLASAGVDYLDAPVSGGESGATGGTLSIMVGGEARVVEHCRPIFEILGSRVTHMGPVGAGQATKLCNQVVVLGNLLAACEGLRLGAACGLEPARLIEALGGGAAGSWQLENLGPKISVRDFAPGFLIRLARKDFRLVMEAADRLRLPLPGSALVQQLLTSASIGNGESLGTQAIVLALEKLAADPSS